MEGVVSVGRERALKRKSVKKATNPYKQFMGALRLEGKAEETLRAYDKCLRTYEEFIKDNELARDGDSLIEFVTYIKDEKKQQPATISLYITVLKRYFDYHDIKRPKIKTPAVQMGAPKYLERDAFLKLYEATDGDPQFRAMLSVDYATAMRRSELISRKMSDLDMDKKQIFVHGKTPEASDAWIPLGQTAINDLQAYFLWLSENDFPRLEPDDYIFHRLGSPKMRYCESTMTIRLYRYCKRARVKKISWHKVRHTRATHLLQDGVSIYTIQNLLRHHDPRTTARYARHDTESLRAATEGKGVL